MRKSFSVSRIKNSFRYAFRGLHLLIFNEANAKIHAAAALVAILLGLILKINALEWCVVILAIGGVFSLEAINTAMERLADKLHPGKAKEIRDLKDIAASAVLIISIASAMVGILIFAPKIIRLFY